MISCGRTKVGRGVRRSELMLWVPKEGPSSCGDLTKGEEEADTRF